jgi:S1-C subfamily serine protease
VEGRDQALLVVAVTPGSPAAAGGLLVGDIMLEFDGHPVESPEDLLDLLLGDRVGRSVPVRLLRGGAPKDAAIAVSERPER